MQRSEPSNVVASLFLDHPVHVYATWRIRLNDPCLAAMWVVASITVATCLSFMQSNRHCYSGQRRPPGAATKGRALMPSPSSSEYVTAHYGRRSCLSWWNNLYLVMSHLPRRAVSLQELRKPRSDIGKNYALLGKHGRYREYI